MSRNELLYWKGLLLAALVLLAILVPGAAHAQADFDSGIVNNGGARLWFQSRVGSTLAIAHYRVDGGAELNVNMQRIDGGARVEYPLAAATGARVEVQFTYNVNGGLERSSPWLPVMTVPPPAGAPSAVAAPAFTPPSGTYTSTQQVTVRSATAGAAVFCAINGAAASPCPATLTIGASTSIAAYATRSGMTNSPTVTAAYVIGSASATPTHGVIDQGASLILWMKPGSAASFVDAHYALGGAGRQNVGMRAVNDRFEYTIPATAGAALTLNYSFTYFTDVGRELTGLPAWTRGASTAVATPVISPGGGTFSTAQSVTMASATPGATVRYTLDGTAPNAASTLYNGAILLDAPGATVKALATLNGQVSPVATASFVITQARVASPVFSLPSGTYPAGQTVSLSSTTPQATIRYTLDGSQPGTASQLYTAPIALSAPGATISAVAFKAGMTASNAASASYTVGAGNAFTHGISEGNGTAVAWFKLDWTPAVRIVHYKHGDGAQLSVLASYNALRGRWETEPFAVTADETLQYSFTHSNSGQGETTTTWFSYKVCGGAAACAIPKPRFSLPTGVYNSAQSVTLSLPANAPAGARIRYTLDTSIPSLASPLYAGGAIQLSAPTTIRAITVLPNEDSSAVASASYSILSGCEAAARCPIAAPVFSIPAGTYDTRIAVTLMTDTMGANIYYTLDGSTPTVHSTRYSGGGGIESDWTRWTTQAARNGGAVKVTAIAIRDGVSSPLASATYVVTSQVKTAWNDGKVSVAIVNNTGQPADKVYWMIVGRRWSDHRFVWVDATGAQRLMQQSDNVDPIPGRQDNGDGVNKTTRYFHSLATLASVSIEPIESARLYVSVGEPVKVSVTADGYAGPDFKNKSDPSRLIHYDFTELNIIGPNPKLQGLWVNTSRVDMFGLPLKLEVTGLDHFKATVGEPLSETKATLFTRFAAESDSAFEDLAAVWAPYRIVAPAHSYFNDEIDITTGLPKAGEVRGKHADYLDRYIDELWHKYAGEDLVLTLGGVQYRGRVNAATERMTFTDAAGSYYIHGKPSTTEVLLGYGKLDDGRDLNGVKMAPDSQPYLKQLQLQAQLCAAINRHVAELGTDKWWDEAYFYPAGQVSNLYARFWHRHSINSLAYGFAYDDVGEHSPSIYTPTPQSITVTIGR